MDKPSERDSLLDTLRVAIAFAGWLGCYQGAIIIIIIRRSKERRGERAHRPPLALKSSPAQTHRDRTEHTQQLFSNSTESIIDGHHRSVSGTEREREKEREKDDAILVVEDNAASAIIIIIVVNSLSSLSFLYHFR